MNTTENTDYEPTADEVRSHRLRNAAIKLVTSLQTGDAVDEAWEQLRVVMSVAVSCSSSSLIVETDLSALWDAELPKATLAARTDGKCLLYPGKIHWLSGEPGSGKTFLALSWTIEQVRVGKLVVFIDQESDAHTITARLRSLGATREELRLVRYLSVRWEMKSLASTIEAIVAKMTEGETPALVVLDGLATALAQLGLDENSNSDISRFTSLVLRPLTSAGAALVVVDHLAKPQGGNNGGAPSRYSRGGGAKLADASGVAYVLHVVVPFSMHKPGKSNMGIGKDRNGDVGAGGEIIAEVDFTPGDGVLVLDVNPPADSDDRWIPNGLMSKLSTLLATAGTMTATEASTALGSKTWQKHGSTVTGLLEKHGFISVERKGTSKLIMHVKLFTDSDADGVRNSEFGAAVPSSEPTAPMDNPF